MVDVLHIYIIASGASEIFSKMYSEYAENVYNVERNLRLLKKWGEDWKLWEELSRHLWGGGVIPPPPKKKVSG